MTSRVVLLDVDGTLVDYTAHLPDSAATAVRGARANGHRVLLCTGRAKAEIYPELWELGVDGLIGGNGAYVEVAGEVVHKQVLAPEAVTRAVDWLIARGIGFYVECNAGLFGSDNLPEAVASLFEGGASLENIQRARDGVPHMIYGAFTNAPDDADWRTDANKISFVLRDDIDLDALARDFAGASKIDTWTLTGRGAEFGEFGQFGVHKGAAVELLAAHLGVPASDMIGIGDARSDLELLTTCGTGVAMGQAPDEVKAAATFVTDPVDADGLARAFERLGLVGRNR